MIESGEKYDLITVSTLFEDLRSENKSCITTPRFYSSLFRHF